MQFKGSCINLKPYTLSLKKAHFYKKRCKTGVCFSRGKPLLGKNINSELTKVPIIHILLCVAINLLANVVVGFFVSSLKW